jgi:hypothetical protein
VKGAAPPIKDARKPPGLGEPALPADAALDDELIMHLERDQFVDATSQPVPRAALSRSALVGLWALRVFVVLVSLMVIYTFFDKLH